MIHTISKIRVRYAETDRMDVVYHSNYFVWFETARIMMLDQIGSPYKAIETNGHFIPVLEAKASYLSPARFDDRLDVHIYMRKKPLVRFYFWTVTLLDLFLVTQVTLFKQIKYNNTKLTIFGLHKTPP